MTHASDALVTPSERAGLLVGNLHPVTRLLALVVILHLGSTLIDITGSLAHRAQVWVNYTLIEHIAVEAKALALSLSLFVGPVVVELLFRIWKALSDR